MATKPPAGSTGGAGVGWNANIVRVPLNQDCWLSDPSNPSYDPTYATTVDEQVQWAEQYGMDIILDLHWSDKGTYSVGQACLAAAQTATGDCQQAMADAHSLTFWTQVATKYKSDQHVLFELYNEPFVGRGPNPPSTSWDTWLNGGADSSDGFTVVGMQQLYNAVRTAGANNLVIIGGLYWANDLSGIATHAVQGTNILYAAHVYETGTGALPTISTVAQTYPVILTEFGDRSGSCATATDTTVTQYANKQGSNAPPVELSWTAWAFYAAANLCTFPSLISDEVSYTPTAEGKIVQAALIAGP
jgi:aryl-phospho-beta-D-glucosidase BglC (GH1 family)